LLSVDYNYDMSKEEEKQQDNKYCMKVLADCLEKADPKQKEPELQNNFM